MKARVTHFRVADRVATWFTDSPRFITTACGLSRIGPPWVWTKDPNDCDCNSCTRTVAYREAKQRIRDDRTAALEYALEAKGGTR